MDYYQNLYFALDQLIEVGEDADTVYDAMVDHLAYRAEEYQAKANRFGELLNRTRDNDPVESIPDEPQRPSWEDIYGGMSDIDREFMSGSPDEFMEFVRRMSFGDKMGDK